MKISEKLDAIRKEYEVQDLHYKGYVSIRDGDELDGKIVKCLEECANDFVTMTNCVECGPGYENRFYAYAYLNEENELCQFEFVYEIM